MRPMALASHAVLYIGTQQGRLQRVHLPSPGVPERWEQLWENGCKEALMCLAVRPLTLPSLPDFVGMPSARCNRSRTSAVRLHF